MQVGFAGLGTMGFAMAANLVKAGFAVRAWNRSKEPISKLAALGARAAESPADVAAEADILITMLADDQAMHAVLVEGGALAALKAGSLHVNMATVSVALAREMVALHEACGVSYLAAPVLGRVNVAEAGKLNILVAGRPALIERAQPLFDAMGQKTWRFGESPAQANAAKLATNFMIASAIETMSEAATLAKAHGVDAAAFLDMVTSTAFASPVYKGYGDAIAQNRFEPPGFKLALALKDVRLGLEAAEAVKVPMPFASVLKDNLLDSLAHGEGNLDLGALSKVAARRAGQG